MVCIMRIDDMRVTESKSGDSVIYTIEGVISDNNYRDIERQIKPTTCSATVIMEMSLVSSLSSAGLGAIASLIEYADEAGRRLFIMNPSTAVRLLIDSTGFPEFFNMINDYNEILSE